MRIEGHDDRRRAPLAGAPFHPLEDLDVAPVQAVEIAQRQHGADPSCRPGVIGKMNDVHAFREGCGRLLAEVQRIKSEGDYAAAKTLFETYGIHFDPKLRDEIVKRVDDLNLPSYTGFVMPKLTAVTDASGTITDVTVSYPQDLTTQMLEYSGTAK